MYRNPTALTICLHFFANLLNVVDCNLEIADYRQDEEKNSLILGQHLRIAVYIARPLFYISRINPLNKTDIEYSGFYKDIIDLLAQSLQFTYSFIVATDEEVAKFGVGEAVVNYLIRNEADMIGSLTALALDRSRKGDFSAAVISGQFLLVEPMPAIQNRFFAPIKPFQPLVWLLVGVSLVVVSAVSSVIINLLGHNISSIYLNFSKKTMADYTLYATQVITARGCYLKRNKKLFVRILSSVWCLMAIILISYYNSMFISYLTVPKHEPLINTLEELAKSKSQCLIVEKGSVHANMILNAESGALKTIGNSLRNHPEHLSTSIKQVNALMESKSCYFLTTTSLGATYVYNDMKANNGQCRFTTSSPLNIYFYYSFLTKKGFLHRTVINQQLMRFQESGIINQLGYRHSIRKTVERCMIRNIEAESQAGDALTLFTLVSAFLILGIGIGLSLLVFSIELIVFLFTKRIENQQPSQHAITTSPLTAFQIKKIKTFTSHYDLNDAVETKKIKTDQDQAEIVGIKEAHAVKSCDPVDRLAEMASNTNKKGQVEDQIII